MAGLFRALQQDRGIDLIGRYALQRGFQQIGQKDFGVGAHGTRIEFETADYSGTESPAPARM